MKFFLILFITISSNTRADLKYESTINSGQNKYDRIAGIEKYLSGLETEIGFIQKKLTDSDALLNREILKNREQLTELKNVIDSLTRPTQSTEKNNESQNLITKINQLTEQNKILTEKLEQMGTTLEILDKSFKKSQERDISN